MKKKYKFTKIYFYFKNNWKEGIGALLFTILVSISALPTPYLMKYIVDDVIVRKNLKLLNLIILAIVGIQVLRVVFSFLTNYWFSVLNQEILTNIKKDLFSKLLRLPLSFFDSQQSVEGLGFFIFKLLTIANESLNFLKERFRI